MSGILNAHYWLELGRSMAFRQASHTLDRKAAEVGEVLQAQALRATANELMETSRNIYSELYALARRQVKP